tara:strand:+ start:23407 stop:23679 length:273 start_codon:yes stop_codon:yes gene_type:complete
MIGSTSSGEGLFLASGAAKAPGILSAENPEQAAERSGAFSDLVIAAKNKTWREAKLKTTRKRPRCSKPNIHALARSGQVRTMSNLCPRWL